MPQRTLLLLQRGAAAVEVVPPMTDGKRGPPRTAGGTRGRHMGIPDRTHMLRRREVRTLMTILRQMGMVRHHLLGMDHHRRLDMVHLHQAMDPPRLVMDHRRQQVTDHRLQGTDRRHQDTDLRRLGMGHPLAMDHRLQGMVRHRPAMGLLPLSSTWAWAMVHHHLAMDHRHLVMGPSGRRPCCLASGPRLLGMVLRQVPVLAPQAWDLDACWGE